MDSTNTSSSPPTFIFPVLKQSEIIQCLSELGLEVSKAELLEPQRNKEKLRNMILHMLELCTGKTEADFQASPAETNKASTLPYPELHTAESFSELKFFEAFRDLLVICGYFEFSWRDIYAPESKRLRHQLSALINLAKFREEQLKLLAELNEPRGVLLNNLEVLNNENMELNRQLEVTEKETETKLLEMEEVIRECEELELEIAHNNRLQSTAREEGAAFKKQANDLKDELATAEWALQEAEAEEERLRLEVVSSPDRRKAEIVNRRQRLDRTKQECADLEREMQESKTKIVHAKQFSKEFETINNILDELQEQATKYGEIVRQLDEARSKIQASERQSAEIVQETEQAERELHRVEEKIVHLRQQHKVEIEAVQEQLEQAKSQLLAVEKDRRDGQARVEAGEAEVRELEAAMERERAQTTREIEAMIDEYKETEKLFLERNAKRMSMIEASSE